MKLMERNKLNVRLLSVLGQRGSISGFALPNIVKEYPNVIAISADQVFASALDRFKATNPDKLINVGIAEQNMIGFAAGLSEEGFIPVCFAQACFLTMRSFEQVRQYAGYMGIPMVLVGISSGYDTRLMGNTHYALEDIALMRTIPNMTVVAPCDALQATLAIEAAVASHKPVYIRTYGEPGIAPVYKDNSAPFKLGKANILRTGTDLKIVATGSMVLQALKVADRLSQLGIEATVVDMHTIKPLDTSVLNDASLVVTIEEHRLMGGLGDAVASYYMSLEGDRPALIKCAVPNEFGPVGDIPFMWDYAGLTTEKILSKILLNIKKRNG
jgi:transketolase